MRILQVRFKNLNSLVGEWEIELTHPAFASDGIFAITGPTGAGKTTILDAVCLALYGRTPRLNRVTKSGNEIMSRQTGDCFAEVTFETQAGRYRCHWSQHRARRRPEGELQAPKHEIANADSGEIIEAKIRGVAEQIEVATGMDFDRFTRSMLLAQGGFAAFLQAAPDERAPILEQITGTEIYSQISIRVHNRRSEERERLDTLQAELDGIRLLTPEDEQQLTASLAQKARQDTELSQQVAQRSQAIAWIEGIGRLEDELKALDLEKDELMARTDAFAPVKGRLDAANRALELAADHTALTAIRKEQETDQRTLRKCRESLPNVVATAEQEEGVMKTAVERLEARKAEQKKAQPLLRWVRELDLKIGEKDAPIKTVNDSIAGVTTSLERLKTRQKTDSTELDNKRRALQELQRLLETSRADGELVEHLAGIRGRFEALKALHTQLAGKLEEVGHADNQLQKTSRDSREQTTHAENARRGQDEIQVSLAGKQHELVEILEHQELAEWRKRVSLLAARKELIDKALEAAQALSTSKQASSDLSRRQAALEAEKSALTNALANRTEREAALEREQELLETHLTLLQRIEDLEEARQQLQDDEPCPLCGAKEHPFAEGNTPVPDETRRKLTALRGDLKSVSGEISSLKVKHAKLSKDIEQALSAQEAHAEIVEGAKSLIAEACSELPADLQLTAEDPELEERLKVVQRKNSRLHTHASHTLEAAEAAERAVNTLREAREKASNFVVKAEREAQTAAHKKDSAGQLLERLNKEVDEYRDQQKRTLDLLQKETHAFRVQTLSIDTLDGALQQLTSRRDQWLTRQNEKSGFEQKIAALEKDTDHQAVEIQKSQKELENQREQLAALLHKRDALARERKDIFGDKKADEEESHLSTAVESSDRELETVRQKLQAAKQELSQLRAKTQEVEKAVERRELQLRSSHEAFRIRLKDSGFSDEQDYNSACLSKDERESLARQDQKLSGEKTELIAREREKTKLLETERRKRVTVQPLDELKETLALLLANQKELQQEVGAIRQRLKDNDGLKQQQQRRVQAIDAQRRECSRWDLLHELIGSADGKKYRNFAQGLTFEMMIGHANRQLQKMTDRYLLIRDDGQPLELNVIDNYQAGEVRSTKNLSGGESFIVSLSLALGLSNMASKNVRVDSLFLDEGFGTLDEEALDTALETLSGLQQEGKLIGVISHVSALKERIGTQIQVDPQTGGRSIISGPGCQRH